MGDGIDIDGGFLYASTGQHRKTGSCGVEARGGGTGLKFSTFPTYAVRAKFRASNFPKFISVPAIIGRRAFRETTALLPTP